MRRSRAQRGFTLVELVIVIILLGIISAVLAPILTSNVTAYTETRARADLTARGRLALERLSRELHRAVPNSLRVVSGNTIEFVTASSGGRYVDRDDSLISAGSCPIARRFRTGFSLTQLCLLQADSPAPFVTGDIVVIGNTSPITLENSASRADIGAVSGSTPLWTVSFSAAKTFNDASPGKHYTIADASHEVGQSGGALHWRRHDGIAAAEYDGAVDVSGADPLLIDGVSAIAYSYNAAADGMLKVELTLSDGGETVQLYEEIYVRNTQ
jgi:MSHA biogenesis protein MshO